MPFSRPYVASLHHYTVKGQEDLLPRVSSIPNTGDFSLQLDTAGTHLFTYEGHPNRITLSAEKFHAYLQLEGLQHIIASREASGTAMKPGRERYRRFVKTFVDVGGESDATSSIETGQRLEILPSGQLGRARTGDLMEWRLLYEGKPLAGALVKAWHLRGTQQLVIQTRTDAAGHFVFALPYSGSWMLSVVHMVPASDPAIDDWDSLWGNLTFALRPAS